MEAAGPWLLVPVRGQLDRHQEHVAADCDWTGGRDAWRDAGHVCAPTDAYGRSSRPHRNDRTHAAADSRYAVTPSNSGIDIRFLRRRHSSGRAARSGQRESRAFGAAADRGAASRRPRCRAPATAMTTASCVDGEGRSAIAFIPAMVVKCALLFETRRVCGTAPASPSQGDSGSRDLLAVKGGAARLAAGPQSPVQVLRRSPPPLPGWPRHRRRDCQLSRMLLLWASLWADDSLDWVRRCRTPGE